MRRSELKRRTPLKAGARKRKATIHPHARGRARSRSLGLCIVCLHRAGIDPRRTSTARLQELVDGGVVRASTILHHVLPERLWPDLAECDDNLVCVCKPHHDAHEVIGVKRERIPIAALPPCSIDLAAREGERAVRYLDVTYAR